MAPIRAFWQHLARAAARVWFRDVEVVGRWRLPEGRPLLLVASHFNGLLDPVLLTLTLPRLPRFLAKATLWRVRPLGVLLASMGALPVYRAHEGSTTRNLESFAACFAALRSGDSVALFPEGHTHDAPRLGALRTGAARLALGARDAGVRGLCIVPVGLIYGAKTSPRSRALVRFGEPIDLDAELDRFVDSDGQSPPTGRAAARRLTDEIRRRLAEAALDYEDPAAALRAVHAGAVALRPTGADRAWRPGLDEIERTARALLAAPAAAQERLQAAISAYLDALALLGLADADVASGAIGARQLRWGIGQLALAGGALPVAALGVVVNGPATAASWAAGRLPVSTPMRATARLLTGLGGLLASWVGLRTALARRGWHEPTLTAAAAGPGCGLVALTLAERLRALRSARRGAAVLRAHHAVRPALWQLREQVVRTVAEALGEDGAEHPNAPRPLGSARS